MITLSFDVTKLDKSKFVTGKKGTYCNLVLIETPTSEYGDYMVKQDSTKEQREAGEQTPILGNAKVMRKRTNDAPPPRERRAASPQPDDDEIPF